MRLTSIILSVLLVLHACALEQDDQNVKKRVLAFLDLKAVAQSMHSVGTQVEHPPITRNDPPPTKQQYVALYNALATLQDTRGGYLTTLGLYVASVKEHRPSKNQVTRRRALEAQVEALKKNLEGLSTTMAPLRISLGINAPELSDIITDYAQSKRSKSSELGSGIIETLDVSELMALESQAIENGKKLKKAIQELRDFVKQKYPDIA